MNIPLISILPDPYGTALLVVLLILAFVVAFKIMKMVFQTILVAILSGGFYVALAILFSYPMSLNNILTFAFAGSTLYMVFSFLASAYGIAHRLISIPYTILKIILKPVKGLWNDFREKRKLQSIKDEMKKDFAPEKPSRRDPDDDEDDKDTREVVLDKVRQKDDDDE
ncbi:MAG: hypothetical protein ABEJ99_02220 [Candidatus Nanohaloarchaea archaeon]